MLGAHALYGRGVGLVRALRIVSIFLNPQTVPESPFDVSSCSHIGEKWTVWVCPLAIIHFAAAWICGFFSPVNSA